MVHNSSFQINLELHSCSGKFTTTTEAFVLPTIVPPQPTKPFNTSDWNLTDNINLTDACFNQMNKMYTLIGAELCHLLMRSQQIRISKNVPILQNTALGWIVTGKLKKTTTTT